MRIIAHPQRESLRPRDEMRMKRHDWRDAVRDLSRTLSIRLHDQRLGMA